jgi:carbon-monoxide dehydrogenase medium subunit
MSFGSPYLTLPDFTYHKASSVDEVIALLKEHGDEAKVMAGGVGLIAFMKERLMSPAHIIDVKGVAELKQLRYAPSRGLSVGASVTYEELVSSDVLKEKYSVLHEAVSRTGDPMIRARATLVGNVCEAIPWIDSAPALISLDASVEIAGVRGKRTVPVSGFIRGPVDIDLEPDEFVTGIQIPDPVRGTRGAFEKFTGGSEFAVASVAVTLASENKRKKARVVFGSVNSTPVRCKEAEKVLEEGELTQATIKRAAKVAAESVECVSDVLASTEYRKHLVELVTLQALWRLL